MPANSDIGYRIKENYEKISQTKLMRRVPVAIRIDGKAFHTFTRGFEKPFDKVFMSSMQETMRYLCKNIQGCVFGYTQSDEITLILIDYQNLGTAAWFNYEVQKLCSISASMATMAFNKFFEKELDKWWENSDAYYPGYTYEDLDKEKYPELYAQAKTYYTALEKGAMFDARCFNVPKEEVCNLIYWRQLDATRNAIQSVGHANFSQKELQGLSCAQIQEKLFSEKNINFNDYPVFCKRGASCLKSDTVWYIDKGMPILIGENRKYVNDCILYSE